jgi:hypothetical protein
VRGISHSALRSVLAISLCFGLTACGDDDDNNNVGNTNPPTSTTEPPTSNDEDNGGNNGNDNNPRPPARAWRQVTFNAYTDMIDDTCHPINGYTLVIRSDGRYTEKGCYGTRNGRLNATERAVFDTLANRSARSNLSIRHCGGDIHPIAGDEILLSRVSPRNTRRVYETSFDDAECTWGDAEAAKRLHDFMNQMQSEYDADLAPHPVEESP